MVELTKSARVKGAVLSAPYLIPLYIRQFNPTITKNILYGMVPFRSSLEIECFGSLQWALSLAENRVISSKEMMERYDLVDYDEDCFHHSTNLYTEDFGSYLVRLPRETALKAFKEYSPLFENSHERDEIAFWLNHRYEQPSINEHRISLKNYTSLNGLYNLLADMQKYCFLNEGSGIHIHVDFSKYAYEYNDVVNAITKNMSKIRKIFDPNNEKEFSYDGVEDRHKYSEWVKINRPSTEYTIEFRLGDMTFDYEEIVRWIIGCNSFVKEIYSLIGINYRNGEKLGSSPSQRIVEPRRRSRRSVMDQSLAC